MKKPTALVTTLSLSLLGLATLCLTSQADTNIVANENFDSGTATNWNNNAVETSNPGGAFTPGFLGRHAGQASQQLFKTFTLPPQTESVDISFDFYEIDSWDTERFQVFIDDVVVFDETFRSGQTDTYPGVTSTPSASLGFGVWQEQFHSMSFFVPTTNGTVKLGFAAHTNQGVADESMGIDNVRVVANVFPGPPTLDSVNPVDDAVDVQVYTNLTATFSELVTANSGNITNSNLTDSTAIVIPVGDAQVSIAGSTMTIDPNANLLPNKEYAVLIDPGAVVDVTTNAFAGLAHDGTWTFTTAGLDLTPPVISSLSPTNGAAGVLTATELVITFNEPVQKGSGDIVIRKLSNGAEVETIDVNGGNVLINGAVVTITPSNALDAITGYYVEIDGGALEDPVSNPFGEISGNTTWSFTTHRISFHPITTDADSGIETAKVYTHAIDFGNNAAFPVATINGVVFANGGIGPFPTIAGTSQTVGSGSTTLPTSHKGNGGANGFLAPGAVRNLVADFIFGNAAGQIELTGLTTGQTYEVRLYDRAWGLGDNRNQSIEFSTDGIAGAEDSGNFNEDDATALDARLDTAGRVNALSYIYTPTSTNLVININRTGGGTYHLYGLTNEEILADVIPSVVSLDPPDDATEVPVFTNLTMIFDTFIATGPGNITISNVTDGISTVIPAGDPQVSVDQKTLTIDPNTNLVPLKDYVILIDTNAIANRFSSLFPGISNDGSWTFRTADPDVTPPLVATLSPPNSSTEAPLAVELIITFDEPVQQGAGDIVIRNASDSNIVEIIASASATFAGAEATIHPTNILAATTGYYVEIDAGAFVDLSGNDFAGISGPATWSFSTTEAGEFAYVHITGDADSGIHTNTVYTHALDFGRGNPGALINGVQFAAYNAAANGSLNFSRTVAAGTLNDNPGNAAHNVTGNLANLMTDMLFNGNNEPDSTTTWTLSGLTPGLTYDTRVYVRKWGASSLRLVNLVFDPDGAGPRADTTGTISEDDATSVGMAAANDAYYISYTFTALTSELVITATQENNNYSWHLYGLSNQESTPPADLAIGAISYTGGITPSTTISFNSLPGRNYKIEARFDLQTGDWFELVDVLPSQGLQTSYIDTVGAGMDRVYYRVRENE